MTAGVLVGLVLLAVAGVTEGLGALWRHGGPYQVIPYPALLVVVLLPTVCSVAVLLRGLALYWRAVHGPLRGLADWRALGTRAGRRGPAPEHARWRGGVLSAGR